VKERKAAGDEAYPPSPSSFQVFPSFPFSLFFSQRVQAGGRMKGKHGRGSHSFLFFLFFLLLFEAVPPLFPPPSWAKGVDPVLQERTIRRSRLKTKPPPFFFLFPFFGVFPLSFIFLPLERRKERDEVDGAKSPSSSSPPGSPFFPLFAGIETGKRWENGKIRLPFPFRRAPPSLSLKKDIGQG